MESTFNVSSTSQQNEYQSMYALESFNQRLNELRRRRLDFILTSRKSTGKQDLTLCVDSPFMTCNKAYSRKTTESCSFPLALLNGQFTNIHCTNKNIIL